MNVLNIAKVEGAESYLNPEYAKRKLKLKLRRKQEIKCRHAVNSRARVIEIKTHVLPHVLNQARNMILPHLLQENDKIFTRVVHLPEELQEVFL